MEESGNDGFHNAPTRQAAMQERMENSKEEQMTKEEEVKFIRGK